MSKKVKAKKSQPSDLDRAAELREYYERGTFPQQTEVVSNVLSKLFEGAGELQVFGPFDLNVASDPVPAKKVTISRIRGELNRPFTDAHIEDFLRHPLINFKVSVRRNDPKHIFAEGPMDSRKLSEVIEQVLADSYANYLIRHWRTFSEYSGPNRPQ